MSEWLKGKPMKDDLISRQKMRAAMYHEAMEKDSDEQKWDGGCWIRYKMFERVVESLPSEEPERKKGKWIYYLKASGSVTSTAVHLYPVCSECGCEHPITNFCPNCGAKMKGEDGE